MEIRRAIAEFQTRPANCRRYGNIGLTHELRARAPCPSPDYIFIRAAFDYTATRTRSNVIILTNVKQPIFPRARASPHLIIHASTQHIRGIGGHAKDLHDLRFYATGDTTVHDAPWIIRDARYGLKA